MQEQTVDWKSLEFKCVHEADLLPKPDPEADEWYRQANAVFKAGVQKDSFALLTSSFELTLKAAERNHVKAMNNLVLAYLGGDGVKQSDSKAVHWAEELIKRNIGMGYYHMGTFLQQGTGVKQDRVAALTYFRKSADLGNAQGQLVVADKISASVASLAGDEKDRGFGIARGMLQCALNQGLGDAGYSLGLQFQIYEEKMPEALIAFQAAAGLGHGQSLWALHTIFGQGKSSISADPARAACYKRLSDQSDDDKTKKFPDIDKLCPLPPKPMPRS